MPPEKHRSGRRSSVAAFVVDHAKTEFDPSDDIRLEDEKALGKAGEELHRELARKNSRTRERRSSLAVNPTWGGPHVDVGLHSALASGSSPLPALAQGVGGATSASAICQLPRNSP